MAMASTDSSLSAKMDLTSCSICFETFKTPKYFPCLHSFCEGCIKTYITTTFVQKKGGIHCPLCRLFVPKSKDVSIEEWSTKLPTNHILLSLIDIKESKSDKKLCTACARENESESACSWCVNCSESLCKVCDRSHRRNKFTSSHTLVELATSETCEMQLHHADIPCTEHPDKKVEAFCTDHNVVCCMTCVMLKHRKCENVGCVEDASDQKKKSSEVQEFTKDLQNLKKSLDEMVNDRSENLQHFDKDIQNIKDEIDRLFTRISSHLNRLKSDMLSEISQIEKEIRPEIVYKRDEIKCKMSTIENDIALFQTNMKYAPPARFLQAIEKLMEQKLILEKFVKDQNQEIKDVEITFEANKKILEIEKDIGLLGKINLRRSEKDDLPQSTYTFIDMSSAIPILSSVVDIQSLVTGIAVLDTGHVVLSDHSAKTLKLRDQHCTTVLSSLSLPGWPYGIKMTSDTEGAVAVLGHGLVIFNIQNNQITKIKEIRTNVNVDFVYYRDRYVIGYGQNIAVYDSSLSKIRDISVNNAVNFMALRDDNSLCYTSGRNVYCITMDGTPVFTYSHDRLRNPYGTKVYKSRHIFVCCYSFKNVHQLSHDGKLQRIIFDNIPSFPYCISFNTLVDRAVVGCNNKIALYDLK
ncbi:hypothetical protein FSP39_015026 [Pinctada imbricata]|uniref:Uncharacterized protein n=1 Tax=Pinctada imbricata TaxID=66713 RepID=A0AA89BZ69_PINIB|nr:hypothetical protein FSP39_015026 [Pinctada imbricata]